MPHVKVVAAAVRLKIVELCRGPGFVRAGCVAIAVGERVLHVHCQPAAVAALERHLQSIVGIVATARFIVDLGIRVLDRRAVDYAELADRVHADHLASHRIGPVDDADAGRNIRSVDYRSAARQDLVRDASQEQVAALAADVGDGRDHVVSPSLLPRERVLEDELRYLVIARIRTRLIAAVIRVVIKVCDDPRNIRRERQQRAVCDSRAYAVALDRLYLVLGLARPVEDAEAAA